MTWMQTIFDERPCGRCGATILAGWHGGLSWRVQAGVTRADARVLDHYGQRVLILISLPTGLWPTDYEPWRDPPPGARLATAHVCGSTHSQRQEQGNRCNNDTK